MKTFLAILISALVAAAAADAGTITGIVRARGKEGAEQAAGSEKYGSRKFKFAEKVNYDELRDFVVFIEGSLTNLHLSAPARPVQIIAQKDATFRPHVLPIMAGTVVEWPNHDEIFHNAFSFSEAKQFDLGLYGKESATNIVFDTSGRVDVFCSIHKDMHCIIMVLQNPYFTMTDSRGHYSITNVPPGKYKLKAWHERLPAQSIEITVPETGEAKSDFTLGWPAPPRN